MNTSEEFSQQVRERLLAGAGFRGPTWYYDEDGDSVEFLQTQGPFKAERVDGWVTVYVGQESGEMVGFLIKGVKRLCDKYPSLAAIEVHEGRIRLAILLRASGWSHADARTVIYKKMIRAAEDAEADIELAACP